MADILSILLAADRHALEVRFWSRVAKSEDGCWLWTGTRIGKGYGRFSCGRRGGLAMAHRVSWWFATGVWPGDLDVCHHCDNPPCVRPDHLFLGTRLDNIADSIAKGRFNIPARVTAIAKARLVHSVTQRARTHCKRGHEFTEANTFFVSTRHGWRNCRECRRRSELKRRPRKRAAR